jgi:hypothetical protein
MADNRIVATVIPVLDEEEHIERCLCSLIDQTWPAEQHRILVLDSGCVDATMAIVEEVAARSRDAGGPAIEVIDNPRQQVAIARNIALERVGKDVTHMFEMIGHAWVPPNHLQARMEDLEAREASLGVKIGAIGTRVAMSDENLSGQALAIELALMSKLGSGGGQFEQFSVAKQSIVTAFCIHSVEAVRQVGGWDEAWVTGQDHDLNHSISESGWQVWRSPASFLHMAKRKSFVGLTRLGMRYGYWRMRQLISHPKRARMKEFLPWIGAILTFGLIFAGSTFWFIAPSIYLSALVVDSIPVAFDRRRPQLIFTCPIALFILHSSFSAGLLWGLAGWPSPVNDRTGRKVSESG